MSDRETFCPHCDAVAEVRGKSRTVTAPPDWYRCPECFGSTPAHRLPVRKRVHLMRGIPRFPGVSFVGSASSTVSTPATLSTQTISANAGDQLFAQVLGRRDAGSVSPDVSVSWGSASISMLSGAFTYALLAANSYGRCMRHVVSSTQSAVMTFDFSAAAFPPEQRLINVIRVSGLEATTTSFDDQEEQFGYPHSINTLLQGPAGADFFILCHGRYNASAGGQRVSWNPTLSEKAFSEVNGLTNSILTTDSYTTSPTVFTATSGPAVDHGSGWFVLAYNP